MRLFDISTAVALVDRFILVVSLVSCGYDGSNSGKGSDKDRRKLSVRSQKFHGSLQLLPPKGAVIIGTHPARGDALGLILFKSVELYASNLLPSFLV